MTTINSFPNQESLTKNLTNMVEEELNSAISQNNLTSIVVSGGSTPKPFFNELKKRNIDWSKIYITLADERWVSATSADSNENLVRANLLAENTNFTPLKNSAKTAKEGLNETEEKLRRHKKPFDIVILGMGTDAHFASIFPDSSNLSSLLDPFNQKLCEISSSKNHKYERITLTLSTLLRSHKIIIHITGDKKKTIIENALKSKDCKKYPIYAILEQKKVPVEIYWSP